MKRVLIAAAVLGLAACDAQPQGGVLHDDDLYRPDLQLRAPRSLPAYFDCLRERGFVAVSAHRGGPGPGLAENAIPTFRNTLIAARGAFLEVDVSQTADGVLVLMHDDRADRTTTGTGAIAELDMTQLLAFQLEDERGERVDARVPTLAEALEWNDGKTVLELDIKRGVRYEDVIEVVQAANAMSHVVFVTYSVDGASRLAGLAPQAMIYTPISNVRELDTLERRGVDLSRIVAWVGSDTPDAEFVAALAARGVETRMGMFGDGRDYANAERSGAQIVAADDPSGAVRDIDAADGEQGQAALQCANAG